MIFSEPFTFLNPVDHMRAMRAGNFIDEIFLYSGLSHEVWIKFCDKDYLITSFPRRIKAGIYVANLRAKGFDAYINPLHINS